MIHVQQSVTFSAYHNYRYGDFISREILQGSKECGFFLSAEKVSFPDKSPNIHGSIFDGNGFPVADIINSTVAIKNENYRVHEVEGGICILDKKDNVLFGWRTVVYRNALVTRLLGACCNEGGKQVKSL
ncbi:MAG TPA: hypothetical protein PK544_06210 [Spirochaetota bacterium]|nr:hypothetical protein [Spirochaetota bacterium]HPJ37707.1 hypothetical protein [Spirochaetota bacterium]HPQ53479.1 hypothetical protein [Spirochaetota bacterium]